MKERMRDIIVGDLHGCYPEFISLLKKIQFNSRYDRLILLGDLIDRGDYSWEIFRCVRLLKQQMGERLVILMGNHEDMYLRAAEGDPRAERNWEYNGGSTSIRSFFRNHENIMNSEVVNWFRENLVLFDQCENYQCVHAGLTAENPTENSAYDLVWDRSAIMSHSYNGKLTIIGHTPFEQPGWSHDGRFERIEYGEWFDLPKCGIIALDTGCVFHEKLTAMLIEEGRCRLETVSYGKELPDPAFIEQSTVWEERDGTV